jgi:hypothetical protein
VFAHLSQLTSTALSHLSVILLSFLHTTRARRRRPCASAHSTLVTFVPLTCCVQAPYCRREFLNPASTNT